MTKRSFVLLIVALQALTLHVQGQTNQWDTILKKDNTSIQCKVLKVTEGTIEYKPKAKKVPFLVIARDEVSSIIYSDGTVVPISPRQEKREQQSIELRNVPQEREEICRSCNGTGIVREACVTCNGTGRLKCTNCDNGYVTKWVIVIGGRAHFERLVCSVCNGTTQVTCATCNGAGLITSTCKACGGSGKILLNK